MPADGLDLVSERPKRMIVEGCATAMASAVSAPTLPWLGPVMRNVRPLTWEEKFLTTNEPSVVKL